LLIELEDIKLSLEELMMLEDVTSEEEAVMLLDG
jgi:hypothetical protein